MVHAIIFFLVYLAVIWIFYWLATYVLARLPVPDPPSSWISLVFMVIAVLFSLALLAQLVGVDLGLGQFQLHLK